MHVGMGMTMAVGMARVRVTVTVTVTVTMFKTAIATHDDMYTTYDFHSSLHLLKCVSYTIFIRLNIRFSFVITHD